MRLTLDEYREHDAIGLRELIAAGEVTAAEVEAVAREALDAANAAVNGLAAPPFDPALDADPDGPLAGVPFLIKDFGPMAAGVPFYCGSRALGDGVLARRDSDLMTRFRAAGLVTLGLTTCPSWRSASRPSRGAPARPATRGTSSAASAGPAAVPPRSSRPARCRSRTAATAPARSASPHPAAGSSGSSRAAAAHRRALRSATRCSGSATRSRSRARSATPPTSSTPSTGPPSARSTSRRPQHVPTRASWASTPARCASR